MYPLFGTCIFVILPHHFLVNSSMNSHLFTKKFWNLFSNWANKRRWCHFLKEASKTQRKNSRDRNHLEYSSLVQDLWSNSSQKCQKCIDCNHLENRIFISRRHSKSLPWNVLFLRASALFAKFSNEITSFFFHEYPFQFFFSDCRVEGQKIPGRNFYLWMLSNWLVIYIVVTIPRKSQMPIWDMPQFRKTNFYWNTILGKSRIFFNTLFFSFLNCH